MSEQNVEPAKKKGGLFKKILLVLALIIVVFLIAVAMQPDDYRISRSATMAASPAKVFENVNDFHNWQAWSPWAKMDPNAKNEFEGSPSGKDAVFKWSGNKDVGEGAMTILESQPNDRIRIRLDFIKPFEDTANVEFQFKPEADKTDVIWTMTGKHNFVSKAFCLFMNMDKMVGGDFERGLASLKSVVEAPPKT